MSESFELKPFPGRVPKLPGPAGKVHSPPPTPPDGGQPPESPEPRASRPRNGVIWWLLTGAGLLAGVYYWNPADFTKDLSGTSQRLLKLDVVTLLILLVFGLMALMLWVPAYHRLKRQAREAEAMTARARQVMGRILPERLSLRKCETEIIGTAKAESGPARLVFRLRYDALKHSAESLTMLMARESELSSESIHTFALLQRIALHLGIFGTFWGLLGGLPLLGRVVEGGTGENGAVFSEFFASLAVCFRTSIYGLACWMIAVVLASFLKHNQRIYMADAEDLCLAVQDVFLRATKGDEDAIEQLHDVKRVVSNLTERIRAQGDAFAGFAENLGSQLSFLQPLSDSLDKIKTRLMEDAVRTARDLEAAAAFHEKVQTMHTEMMMKANDTSLVRSFSDALTTATSGFATDIRTDLRSVDGALRDVARSLSRRMSVPNAPTMIVEPDVRSRGFRYALGAAAGIAILLTVLIFSVRSQASSIAALAKTLQSPEPAAIRNPGPPPGTDPGPMPNPSPKAEPPQKTAILPKADVPPKTGLPPAGDPQKSPLSVPPRP